MRNINWLTDRLRQNFDGSCVNWPFGVGAVGYGMVWLQGKMHSVPRLVCSWVYGPAESSQQYVLHSCDNRLCFNPRHLRWGSHADNQTEKLQRGRASGPKGGQNPKSKLTEATVQEVFDKYASGGWTHRTLAREYGVNPTTITRMLNRKNWKWVSLY